MSTWLATYRGTHTSGALFANTICVVCADGGNPEQADMGEIINSVDTELTTLYKACLNAQWTLEELLLRGVGPEDGNADSKQINAAGTLANGSGVLPREICMVLSLRTNYAKRSGHGRLFIPSPMYSSYLNTGDQWATGGAYWTAAAAFGAKLVAGWTLTYGVGGAQSAPMRINVWSRRHQENHEVTSYVRRPQPHWLRSRATSP